MALICAPKDLFWLSFIILVTNLIFLVVMCFYAVIENQHSYSQFQVNNNTALIVAIDKILEKVLKEQITCALGIQYINHTINQARQLVAGGPAGAAVGGAAGGAAMDLLISGSEVLIHGDDGELHGYRTGSIIHDTPPIKSIPGLIKQGVIVTESLPPLVASSSTTISSLGSK
ncbi:hypothetical protein Fcan01_16492 [Folsomia candida]|uniref:Uncharacterized protein n=1 Tax=Folsomia candida TaxID=158441 RepID=A0A226DWQ9_FOLCA|nr:hypothetical protein Fcan01_16492 [Folsomia candida]